MKIIKYIFILSFAFISCFFSLESRYVFASQTYYAQIPKGQEVYLYCTPNSSISERMFVLPETYFVELLKNANDDFYYARYNDLYGYVIKNEVKPVKNIPTSPFLININFRVFVPSGANLRSSPYNNGSLNLVYSIPFLDNNLLYYGQTFGEEAISKKGNVWYSCKYFSGNVTYVGYVYSPLCDDLCQIYENTEVVEYIDNIQFENEETQASTDVFNGLSSTATTIIIIAISLPCLLFIYLLFKPTRLVEQSSTENGLSSRKKHSKKKIRKLKNSDYYELDDDF